MGTVILNVVIILGIIIAGGFLIFFLGDLLMSIVNPKGEEERVKLKRKDSAKKFAKKVEAMPAEGVAGVIEAEPVAEQSDNPGQVRQFGDGVSVSNDNRDRIVVETDGEIVGRSEGIGVSAAPAEDVIPIAEKQADIDDIDAEASVSFENDDTSVYRINGERETATEYHDVYGNELTVVDIDNDALFDGYINTDVAEVYADFEPSVSAVALDDAEMSADESEEYMESGDNTHAEEYSSDTIGDDIIGDEDTFGDDPLA